MKRIIMILTMLLVALNLYSQDFEPSQQKSEPQIYADLIDENDEKSQNH